MLNELIWIHLDSYTGCQIIRTMGTIHYTQNTILLAMYQDHSRYKDVVINPSRQDQVPEAQLFAHRCVLISVSQLFKERIGRGRCMCSVYTPSVSYKTWGRWMSFSTFACNVDFYMIYREIVVRCVVRRSFQIKALLKNFNIQIYKQKRIYVLQHCNVLLVFCLIHIFTVFHAVLWEICYTAICHSDLGQMHYI